MRFNPVRVSHAIDELLDTMPDGAMVRKPAIRGVLIFVDGRAILGGGMIPPPSFFVVVFINVIRWSG